ncbi:hypothetical protein [Actinomadura macra]|uniref:hypothetical protein n=1 Tax=Actinomadura macra TaxID=46164 RepID=UPI0008370096|nr:hypothetical protein [Actinomadura macra]
MAGRIGGTIAIGGGTTVPAVMPVGVRPATVVSATVDMSSTTTGTDLAHRHQFRRLHRRITWLGPDCVANRV